jgi:hypothetical protein
MDATGRARQPAVGAGVAVTYGSGNRWEFIALGQYINVQTSPQSAVPACPRPWGEKGLAPERSHLPARRVRRPET